jgi:hypothetical protein
MIDEKTATAADLVSAAVFSLSRFGEGDQIFHGDGGSRRLYAGIAAAKSSPSLRAQPGKPQPGQTQNDPRQGNGQPKVQTTVGTQSGKQQKQDTVQLQMIGKMHQFRIHVRSSLNLSEVRIQRMLSNKKDSDRKGCKIERKGVK